VEIGFTEYIAITDASSVGEARRRGLMAAERLGFDQVKSGELALLTTEVSRNVLLHAGGGQAIIVGAQNDRGSLARILALDKGPGILDIARAMDDGYSTAGTMGAGMGAMQRMASSLEIFTGRGGTIVFLEVGNASPPNGLQVAGMAIPYPGERLCGDAWTYDQTAERTLVVLVDGLGHGPQAATAASEAVDTFRDRKQDSPGEILSYLHDALRKTRGAVGAVAQISHADKTLTYAGVGNTAAVLLSQGAAKSLVSHNGTLGLAVPRIQEFRVEWPDDGILVMHSDGLQSRWDLSSYSGLLNRHPAVIGAALFRDFRRQRDDASVVVAKAAA
jgi:anti-sigma regulatory factor (Ser/Thr protein kinase)